MIESAGGSIVLRAQAMNPSIFSQSWLIEQKLAEPGELREGKSITLPHMAQHKIQDLLMIVTPPRLQVNFQRTDDSSFGRATELVGEIAGTLPHTPYIALGINFEDRLHLPADEFSSALRTLFLSSSGPFAEHFSVENARFGGYFSTDVGAVRLKLDIKPAVAEDDNEMLVFNSNFHIELQHLERQERVSAIVSGVEGGKGYRDIALEILRSTEAFLERPHAGT